MAQAASLDIGLMRIQMLENYVVTELNNKGVCIVDQFLGSHVASNILEEVKALYDGGSFKPGQVVNPTSKPAEQTVRGDMVAWLFGNEPFCPNVKILIDELTDLITRSGPRLGLHNLGCRTKAMVACYPGNGSHYVMHVDNPELDFRCITCIYYPNKEWNVDKYGGLMQIFPPGKDAVDVNPSFDRLLLFWSDRRNPHRVNPTFAERFAITVWFNRMDNDMHRHDDSSPQPFPSLISLQPRAIGQNATASSFSIL